MSADRLELLRRIATLADREDATPFIRERAGLAKWAAAEIERLQEALSNIQKWAEAYPIDIFHEPTPEECRRAHELLTANGMTLDAFSASMGRHCLRGVGDIARAALKAAEA